MARSGALIAVYGAMAACGGSPMQSDGGDVTVDTVSVDATPDVPVVDVPFMTADHAPATQIPANGGPTIEHVQLVVITYADDPNRADFEAFGQWIGGSHWLTTVGADYLVGSGTLLSSVERTDNAPDAVTSTDIESMLAAGVADGSIPSPVNHDYRNVLYMVFYPAHTTITLLEPRTSPATSCVEFGGYHSEVRSGGLHFAYAAVPDCGGFSADTVAASHEYIEAATDPFPGTNPGYSIGPGADSAWSFIGGEVGDLCELAHTQTTEGSYAVQRIWSNSAAAAGMDPCIPADPTANYFNVAVEPADLQYAVPGDVITFTLTGWSMRAMSPWNLSVMPQGGNLSMAATLSTSHMTNGGTATITIRVPTSEMPGYESFVISSSTTTRQRQVWPIAILVN